MGVSENPVRRRGSTAFTSRTKSSGMSEALRGRDRGVLIRNARVFTCDDARPWAGAVAVEGERISWLGDDADAPEHLGAASEVIDANGAGVFPGFVDAHNHVRLGSNPGAVQLREPVGCIYSDHAVHLPIWPIAGRVPGGADGTFRDA